MAKNPFNLKTTPKEPVIGPYNISYKRLISNELIISEKINLLINKKYVCIP